MFTHPVTAHRQDPESLRKEETGHVFTPLLLRLWEKYQFPIPTVDDLDPGVAAVASVVADAPLGTPAVGAPALAWRRADLAAIPPVDDLLVIAALCAEGRKSTR